MSRARDLSKLGNPGVFSVSADNNVGVNSTAPVEKLNVVGVVSATSFYGDGSKLEGVSSAGLGTAVVSNSPYGGEQIYYTNKALNITGDLTVDVPDSAEVAYTQYQEIVVDSGADFIVGDGDDFIPDILGIGTEVQQPGLLAGGGGRVRADNFSDKSGTGAPTFSSGVVVTGVATATSFSGNVTGNATGLSGTPDITVSGIEVAGIITAKAGAALTYYGDGSGLTFAPKVIAYDPAALSTGISTTTNITFTFDQNIQFAGTGTIEVRETSNSGTIATSFTISGGTAPTGLSIVNNQLIINPTEPLNYNTVHYVVLPSAGIANAQGSYYAGSNGYNFRTLTASESFSIQGGDHVFDVNTGAGPTGWHRYHVFTSTGILTATAPTYNAASLDYILAAGGGGGGYTGGGGGGLLRQSTSALGIAAGTYTVTVGAGGAHSPAHNSPTDGGSPGEDSTIGTSPTDIILRAYGGGGGGTIHPTSDPIANPGGSGGGVADPSTAGTTIAGGTGVSGQGYPGGPQAGVPYNLGSGGGGSGGAGTSGTQPQNAPIIVIAGDGGAGVQNPSFTDLLLNGRVPSIPATSFAEIGPGGRFCGGGGGGLTVAPPGNPGTYSGGTGGNGGGGDGAPYAGNASQAGYTNTGGGGGGGAYLSDTSTWVVAANGGPGVFMIRYAIPDPS